MLFLASADSDGIVAKQQNSDIVVVFTGVFLYFSTSVYAFINFLVICF